jgi:integrase
VRVDRTVAGIAEEQTYLTPKTKGNRRTVPLTAATTTLVRGLPLAASTPRRPDCAVVPRYAAAGRPPHRLERLTLNQRVEQPGIEPGSRATAKRQASALADLPSTEAEARLLIDWTAPVRHATFYKAVYRPAVLRANRMTPNAVLPPELKFHALRHTYASLCIAAGRPSLEIARFMGHARPSTTEAVYAHLFNTDDHAGAMAALGALGALAAPADGENVVPLRG